MTSKQAEIALAVTDADVAIEQLAFIQRMTGESQVQLLQKALDDAIQVIKRLRSEHAETLAAEAPEKLIMYFSENTKPTAEIQDHTKNMRKGRIRKIDRLIRAEPLFALCVGDPGTEWISRFRVVDSLESAEGLKMLHNI